MVQDVQLEQFEQMKIDEINWNKNPPVSDEIGIIDYDTRLNILDFHNAFNFATKEDADTWIESQRTN
jgi:hypothetical protein